MAAWAHNGEAGSVLDRELKGLGCPSCRKRNDAQEARIKVLEERLEISHAYDIAGNRVPFPEGGPDGIECRNETIRLLETRIKVLEEALRPFACVCQSGCAQRNFDNCTHRKARAALEGE